MRQWEREELERIEKKVIKTYDCMAKDLITTSYSRIEVLRILEGIAKDVGRLRIDSFHRKYRSLNPPRIDPFP